MHRNLLIGIGLTLAAAVTPAEAQAPAGPPPAVSACTEGGPAPPARVIEACDALLTDQRTAAARRAVIYLARAEAFASQGRQRLAVDDLAHVIQLRPDLALAFLRRARLQLALGDAEAALGDFTSAIRLEPANPSALFARGELYRAKADRRRALADYAAVLRLDPSHEAARSQHKALALEIERQGAMMPVPPPQR